MNGIEKKQKILGVSVFLSFYVLAYCGGYFASLWIENLLWRLLFFDVVATVIIWIFSLVMSNSSVYDPYWSLTPLAILLYLAFFDWPLDLYQLIFLFVFGFWSIRLTINWILTFGGLKWEDWRYRKYREENPPWLWHIINFFGIMMFPTLLVFAGLIPGALLLAKPSGWLSLGGDAMIVAGTFLEIFADHDVHAFLKENAALETKPVCQKGLWNYSRHPNYLGEILIWFGVYFAFLPTNRDGWFWFFGAVLILFLFVFVSIPLMEKRQIRRRPDYAAYRKTTSVLLLWPKKPMEK
jgi:steroid 5-alpha reductase family enzyme